MSKSTPVNPVEKKPAKWQPIPPVREPVTGVAKQGYPDGTKGNQLGPKPVGKK